MVGNRDTVQTAEPDTGPPVAVAAAAVRTNGKNPAGPKQRETADARLSGLRPAAEQTDSGLDCSLLAHRRRHPIDDVQDETAVVDEKKRQRPQRAGESSPRRLRANTPPKYPVSEEMNTSIKR